MIIAVDFDGVLCEDKYPEIGPPIMKNINRIKKMQDHGEILILWTCRKEKYLDNAIKWCKSFDLEFDYINENAKTIIKYYKGDSRKIFAHYYIDDKNLNDEEIDKLIESYNINRDKGENMESQLCLFTDLCKNFNSDAIKNVDRKREDTYFCKNCYPYENKDKMCTCKNFEFINNTPQNFKDVKNVYNEPKNYDIVNNPSHYTLGRKFEPAFVINDWGVNWYIGTCIKYLSRLGRKDVSNQDLSKALWYIIAEIAINHKDISKEQIINTINTIYERRDKYEQLKKE